MLPLNSIDLIHTRCLMGCFSDFREVLRKSFRYAKPGGYVECHGLYSTINCDDGTMPEDWEFARWSRRTDEGAMALQAAIGMDGPVRAWIALMRNHARS